MENLLSKILDRSENISVVGLGYVGLPIAVAFAKKANVIGFDLNEDKIKMYQKGIDTTKEIGDLEISSTSVVFTSDPTLLKQAKFHIVSVPTPVNLDHTPDLRPIQLASEIVGKNLTKGSIVVYESTVYPGVTEDICVPILEKNSGLKCGFDFKVGYSPERINPGDKDHRLSNVIKIVSGMDVESLETIAKIYSLVVDVGVYKAESIRVAEAAKVIENAQRDINIAFMNELSIIFHKMGIDTKSVLKAASTKWNFLNFSPGLVGGHCIGVDPYYLTYKAEQLGYHSQIILSGRKINDEMSKYIVDNLIKMMLKSDINLRQARVGILGFTFKENCPDVRNTKVVDIINELKEYGVSSIIYDSEANSFDSDAEYGIQLSSFDDLRNLDALIIAVGHRSFMKLNIEDYKAMFGKNESDSKIIFDLKGLLDKGVVESAGFNYWRL